MAVMYKSPAGTFHIAQGATARRSYCGVDLDNTQAADHTTVSSDDRCGHRVCRRALELRVEQEERTRGLRR